jgi:hypothetical protein
LGKAEDTPVANATLLRLELPNTPGSLAAVAHVLGSCDVNIVRLEVVGSADGVAVDDLLVTDGDLDTAVARFGAGVRVLAREPQGMLPDAGLAMAEAVGYVARELPG